MIHQKTIRRNKNKYKLLKIELTLKLNKIEIELTSQHYPKKHFSGIELDDNKTIAHKEEKVIYENDIEFYRNPFEKSCHKHK